MIVENISLQVKRNNNMKKITSDKYMLNLREDGLIPIGIDSKNDVIYYNYLENGNKKSYDSHHSHL